MKRSRFYSKLEDQRGFALPLALMFIVLAGISGSSFLQLDYLERRMVMNERDNHRAFYLANAGMQRALESFKIPTGEGNASWTGVLDQSDLTNTAIYPTQDPPHEVLCPPASENRGCIMPPFHTVGRNAGIITADGDAVVSPDIPFGGTFDDGNYNVRAFNNAESNPTSKIDHDGILTVRAMASVRGETKMIEVSVKATTNLNLINCQNDDPNAPCPDAQNVNTQIDALEGREPASTSTLPEFDGAYYHDSSHFPCTETREIAGNVTLVSGAPTKAGEVQLFSDTCYYISGNVTVDNVGSGYSNMVIYSGQALEVQGGTTFYGTTLIGTTSVQLQGNIETHSAETYPAIISGGDVQKGDASVVIYGNIFAAGSIGSEQHPWNPNEVHGVIIGGDVYLKAAATLITDDGDEGYYTFMPGFTYPDELVTNQVVSSTWRDSQ